MATRSKNRVSRTTLRGVDTHPRTRRCSSVPRNPVHIASGLKPEQGDGDRQDTLADITRYFKGIVAFAVTAEVALRRQNSEEDADIAECLRHGIVNPLSIQIERVSRLQLPATEDAT